MMQFVCSHYDSVVSATRILLEMNFWWGMKMTFEIQKDQSWLISKWNLQSSVGIILIHISSPFTPLFRRSFLLSSSDSWFWILFYLQLVKKNNRHPTFPSWVSMSVIWMMLITFSSLNFNDVCKLICSLSLLDITKRFMQLKYLII